MLLAGLVNDARGVTTFWPSMLSVVPDNLRSRYRVAGDDTLLSRHNSSRGRGGTGDEPPLPGEYVWEARSGEDEKVSAGSEAR